MVLQIQSLPPRELEFQMFVMDELADEQWITREDTHPVGLALEKACHAAGFTPTVAFAANDETISWD